MIFWGKFIAWALIIVGAIRVVLGLYVLLGLPIAESLVEPVRQMHGATHPINAVNNGIVMCAIGVAYGLLARAASNATTRDDPR